MGRSQCSHQLVTALVLLELVQELEVPLLLLQLGHGLLALLQALLGARQLLPQPLVLLAQPLGLSPQLLLLCLQRPDMGRQCQQEL